MFDYTIVFHLGLENYPLASPEEDSKLVGAAKNVIYVSLGVLAIVDKLTKRLLDPLVTFEYN